MKAITTSLLNHLSGEVTTLATCWKLTRRDGIISGFTDHDHDITVESILYKASTGFTPTAIESTSGLAVDNLDAEGMLADASLTEEDIMAGLYDFAAIEIFMVNYEDVSQGTLKLRRGWLGEVSLQGGRFSAEVRGLAQALAHNIGELYSPSCRAALGDARCKVNLASHTVTGTVDAVSGEERQHFSDLSRSEASGTFMAGKVTFTSGANSGLSMEIKEHVYTSGTGGTFVLALPLPYTIAEGDAYTLIKGCDKTLATCRDRFANVLNFRGEPHVPGLDRMLETAGTRSLQ